MRFPVSATARRSVTAQARSAAAVGGLREGAVAARPAAMSGLGKHLLAACLALIPPAALADCPPEQLDRQRAAARAVFEEVLSQGRIDENEHLYHPDFVARGVSRDASRAEDREAARGWRQAVPDLRMQVLRLVADCDLVAVHWSGSGTNSGSGNGLPATGKTLQNLWGATFFAFRDGRIAEEWTVFDQFTMLSQLGLLSPPATP